MPRAVVLLSGGLDSYTAAAVARRDGFELFALTVRYGQRHAEEIAASRRVAQALGVSRASRARRRPVADGRLGADRRHRRAQGSADRSGDDPGDLRAGPQHGLPVTGAGLGRGAGAARPRHRRERARLFRLSRLPPRVHRRLRGAGEAGHQGRRRRPGLPRPCAAAAPGQGRHRAARRRARSRLRPDPQLLRPRLRAAGPAAAATAAASARPASARPGCSIRSPRRSAAS